MYFIYFSSAAVALYTLSCSPFFFFCDISDHPIHCHRINHIPSLCFCVSSSSTTPLSIALQAVDERTFLVMVEERRGPDALDRPGPIYLSGSWCSATWGNNAPGHHKYSFTSAEETAWMKGRFTWIWLIQWKLCSIHCLGKFLPGISFSNNHSWAISPVCNCLHRIDQTICHLSVFVINNVAASGVALLGTI